MIWIMAIAFIAYSDWRYSGYWQGSHYFVLLILYSLIVAIIRVRRGDGMYRFPDAELPYERLFRFTFTACFSLSFVTYALSRDVWGYQVENYNVLLGCWYFIIAIFMANIYVVFVNKTHVEQTTAYNVHKIQLCIRFPYNIVRHPTYLLMIIHFMVLPIFMGNHFGYAYSILISLLYVYRTYKEDQFLIEKVHVYKYYAKRVRYKLIPGIW